MDLDLGVAHFAVLLEEGDQWISMLRNTVEDDGQKLGFGNTGAASLLNHVGEKIQRSGEVLEAGLHLELGHLGVELSIMKCCALVELFVEHTDHVTGMHHVDGIEDIGIRLLVSASGSSYARSEEGAVLLSTTVRALPPFLNLVIGFEALELQLPSQISLLHEPECHEPKDEA